MKKINWEPIKDFAEIICGVVAYGLIVTASGKAMEHIADEPGNSTALYDDAVNAIMKSSMYSHDKANAIAGLKRYADSSFYRAIIHIANDDSVYSHDKVDMIKELSQN